MNQKKNTLILLVSIPVFSWIFVQALFFSTSLIFNETITRIENVFLDRLFISRYSSSANNAKPVFSSSSASSENILVLTIDKATLDDLSTMKWFLGEKYKSWNLKSWPFDRRVMAMGIDRLKEFRASVIGIDILFRDQRNPIEDASLVESVRKAGNVILAGMLEHTRSGELAEFRRPFSELEQASAGVGFVNVKVDTDGVLRTIPLIVSDKNQNRYLSFDILCWHQKPLHKNYDLKGLNITDSLLKIPLSHTEIKKEIPLYIETENQAHVLINWRGPANTFLNISFKDLFDESKESELQDLIAGKIVLIGFNHPGLQDIYPTPFYSMDRIQTPGVEVHANAINTLMTEQYRAPAHLPAWISFLVYFVLCLILCLVTYHIRIWISLPVFFLQILTLWLLANLGFRVFYTIPQLTASFLALTVAFVVATGFRVILREKEKNMIRKVFNQYVSNQVVDELLDNPENLSMGGSSLEITTLFSDIRGFTTISENKTPEEVVDILNVYFEQMVAIITKYRGTINKFIGDAIMVLYGAPVQKEYNVKDMAVFCVKSAIEMQETMKSSSDPRMKNLYVGIGITTGFSVVGNIGAKKHKDYTAIGDKINLAARLQSKAAAYEVIVDQRTRDLCQDLFEFEAMDPFLVKGKQEVIHAWKVIY